MNEYITKALPQGSSIYYSLRFCPEPQRQALSLLYAFSHELETIVNQGIEPSVAEAKFNWWQEELTRLADGNPSHPLCQSLQPVIQQYGIATQVLQEILAGIRSRLASPSYTDFRHFSEQHYRAISSFPIFVALVNVANNEARPLAFAHDLGIGLQTIEVIHDLRHDLQQGFIYLPENDLHELQVNEQDLLQLKSSPQLTELLNRLAKQAKTYYQQALTKLDANYNQSQAPSLTLAKLYFNLLEEISKDNFDVLQKRIVIPPLRKLWLAWRAKSNSRL